MQRKPLIFADYFKIAEYLKPFRDSGKKIVTTNGCFDLVHAGHVKYLYEAADLGDLLLVGINCNDVIKTLKGPSRPVQDEEERVFLIASLKMVDIAFIFREDDPRTFLDIIKPDIHVKGGDYSQDILERETVENNGGQVRIVSFVDECSTSSLIKKIRL
ncbi:adenylyltransferase/cytidyltransferase family protein [Chitinispirillales bacterium ANBcel5]|uniref:adenylyltransferase/cytidyltransferase family protein n=1 Tax=Cellulosispirillum alkaliphilum TaxID=3039283 RepID=UPI002A597E3D|nr:adenylyltransferase/cytidyltransferase family protein [Chitinispirillales bacterium ANBcel5]